MTAPFIFLSVTVIFALGLLALFLGAHRPAEGWIAWVVGAFRAESRDDLLPPSPRGQEVDLEDLFDEAGEVPGYTTPAELRSPFALTH